MKEVELGSSTEDLRKFVTDLHERIGKLEQRQLPEKYNPIEDLTPIKTYHSPMTIRHMLETADLKKYREEGRRQ
jgi:hypothetical protein